MRGFTKEEREAMRLADEEIDREFRLTNEELKTSWERDKEAVFEGKDAAGQKAAAYYKAYRAANREKIAAYQKAYRAANREKIHARQKTYREANREKICAWQRAYREANREKINEYKRRKYREERAADQAGVRP